MTATRFPEGFLWGASTAAHQIEGNNVNSDWWRREHDPAAKIEEPSLDACDSYHRWEQDMDLLAQLGFTDYRFGVEWARIEPERGFFSRAEIAHYRRMVEGALARGLRPMVTLHHFTVPRWFEDLGGWTAEGAVESFARYVEACAPIIGEGVGHVCTINEPNVIAILAGAVRTGDQPWPTAGGTITPDEESTRALIAAHRAAVVAVRAISPSIKVGWTVANQVYQALPGAEEATAAYARPREDAFIEAARGDDFIGVQSYTRTLIGTGGPVPASDDVERTLTGWEYYPAAVGHALRHTAEVVGDGTPLIVTENGIATADDHRRVDYYAGALEAVAAAIEDGIDVQGYLAWSALDNYEWGSYRPTFGLIAVDPVTFERTVKPSAVWLGGLGRTRELPRTNSPRPAAS
ncbi:glycoside hydrolase family 1 protein [Streptomyces galilaeus]